MSRWTPWSPLSRGSDAPPTVHWCGAREHRPFNPEHTAVTDTPREPYPRRRPIRPRPGCGVSLLTAAPGYIRPIVVGSRRRMTRTDGASPVPSARRPHASWESPAVEHGADDETRRRSSRAGLGGRRRAGACRSRRLLRTARAVAERAQRAGGARHRRQAPLRLRRLPLPAAVDEECLGVGHRGTVQTRRPSSPTRAALVAFDRLQRALAADDSPHNVARGAFVRGEIVDGERLGAVLGNEALDGLVRTGALHSTGAPGRTGLRAQVGVLVAGDLMVVIPPQMEEQGDLAYFGGDSIGLLERAWPLATGGRLAIELGTGTGFLAAALAPRYELVVATESYAPRPRWRRSPSASTARARDRPAAAWRCASPTWRGRLRPGCADFVVANPPFMPSASHDAAGSVLTYADGGPTGLELPTRFIVEGAILLAPGGTAITRCLDISFDDGRRPLADLCVALRAQGFSARIEPNADVRRARHGRSAARRRPARHRDAQRRDPRATPLGGAPPLRRWSPLRRGRRPARRGAARRRRPWGAGTPCGRRSAPCRRPAC